MSKSNPNGRAGRRAVALQYGSVERAPVVVASGMGYMAEKIVEVAAENGVPIYEDNSLTTILSQLQLGQEIPPSLYQAIVEIYIYFLEFDPNNPGTLRRESPKAPPAWPEAAEPAENAAEDDDEEEEDDDEFIEFSPDL